ASGRPGSAWRPASRRGSAPRGEGPRHVGTGTQQGQAPPPGTPVSWPGVQAKTPGAPPPRRRGPGGSLAVAAVVAILGVGWFVAAQRVLLGGAGPSLEQRAVNEAAAVLQYHR